MRSTPPCDQPRKRLTSAGTCSASAGRGESSARTSMRPRRVPSPRLRVTCNSPPGATRWERSLRRSGRWIGLYAEPMRIARFTHNGEVSYGLVLGADGSPAAEGARSAGSASASADAAGNGNGRAASPDPGEDQLLLAQLAGHPFGGREEDIKLTGVRFRLADVRLLAPILPSK